MKQRIKAVQMRLGGHLLTNGSNYKPLEDKVVFRYVYSTVTANALYKELTNGAA